MARPAPVPYDSSKLTILGVIHRDTEAAPLLARWLERWKPGVVTLEFTEYGLAYRVSEGQILKAKVLSVAGDMELRGLNVDGDSLASVLSYLEPSFEHQVTSAYAARYGCPLYLIDDDRFSHERLAAIDELISPENLEALLSGPPISDCRREKTVAGLVFEKGLSLREYTQEMEVRDRQMCEKVARLMSRHEHDRFLHICGWQHLCDPQGIYAFLNPTKVYIHDKTLCV